MVGEGSSGHSQPAPAEPFPGTTARGSGHKPRRPGDASDWPADPLVPGGAGHCFHRVLRDSFACTSAGLCPLAMPSPCMWSRGSPIPGRLHHAAPLSPHLLPRQVTCPSRLWEGTLVSVLVSVWSGTLRAEDGRSVCPGSPGWAWVGRLPARGNCWVPVWRAERAGWRGTHPRGSCWLCWGEGGSSALSCLALLCRGVGPARGLAEGQLPAGGRHRHGGSLLPHARARLIASTQFELMSCFR